MFLFPRFSLPSYPEILPLKPLPKLRKDGALPLTILFLLLVVSLSLRRFTPFIASLNWFLYTSQKQASRSRRFGSSYTLSARDPFREFLFCLQELTLFQAKPLHISASKKSLYHILLSKMYLLPALHHRCSISPAPPSPDRIHPGTGAFFAPRFIPESLPKMGLPPLLLNSMGHLGMENPPRILWAILPSPKFCPPQHAIWIQPYQVGPSYWGNRHVSLFFYTASIQDTDLFSQIFSHLRSMNIPHHYYLQIPHPKHSLKHDYAGHNFKSNQWGTVFQILLNPSMQISHICFCSTAQAIPMPNPRSVSTIIPAPPDLFKNPPRQALRISSLSFIPLSPSSSSTYHPWTIS